jgi:hypothetical protein
MAAKNTPYGPRQRKMILKPKAGRIVLTPKPGRRLVLKRKKK